MMRPFHESVGLAAWMKSEGWSYQTIRAYSAAIGVLSSEDGKTVEEMATDAYRSVVAAKRSQPRFRPALRAWQMF